MRLADRFIASLAAARPNDGADGGGRSPRSRVAVIGRGAGGSPWRRARQRGEQALLAEVDPELADELERLLTQAGRPQLAASVRGLRIVEPCGCGDRNCASFYVVPGSTAARLWGRDGETLTLAPGRGALAIDVAGDRILAVEVVGRRRLADALARLSLRLGWAD